MTKPRDPEALLSAYLLEGMEVLPDRVADAVLDEIHRTRQRAVFGPWRTRSISRVAFAAVAVVAMVALGGAFFAIQRGQPVFGGPGPSASASASASAPAVVGPSETPTATPSPTPVPLRWTQASLDEDWPAPVRAETRRRRERSCRSSGRKTGKRAAIRIPPATPSPMPSRGSTSTRCRSAITMSARSSGSQEPRTWIRPSSGWRTASSRMTTATALRTGGSGSTTSQGPRRIRGNTARGSPTSTPVRRSRRS